MIEITIDVTNATDKERAKLNELYKKPINELCKETTIYYQDDKDDKTQILGSCGGLGVKGILVSQSIEDFKNMSKSLIAYSFDGETYYDYEDIVAMIKNGEKSEFIYVGNKIEYSHKSFIDTDCLIEQMQDKADDVGEWAEGYLCDITKEQKEDLEKTVLVWFNENVTQPSFFNIENSVKFAFNDFQNNYMKTKFKVQ